MHACELIFRPSIVVNCIYTEVLVVLLFNTENNEGFVSMDAELDSSNTYMDVTKLSDRQSNILVLSFYLWYMLLLDMTVHMPF